MTTLAPKSARRGGNRLSLTEWRAALLGVAAGLVAACVIAAPASANAPINSFSIAPSTTQAGGHPDIVTSFTFENRDTQNFPTYCFCQDPENITASLPAGVIGDPHATPQCTAVEFGEKACLTDSQVGYVEVILFEDHFFSPLYNLVPHAGQAGLLGFETALVSTPQFIVISARTGGDYGLNTTVEGLEHVVPPEGVAVHLWGVPDDSSHDAERWPIGGSKTIERQCSYYPPTPSRFPCFPPTPAHSAARPFLDNPTSCSGPLSATLEIVAYDHGTSNAEATYPATTGCDQLAFNPSLFAQPTTTQTDAASGLEVDLRVPQEESPSTPSPSEIRAATVTLPQGFSINPNAADGKTSCSDLEARFGSEEEALCPEFSKIGTAIITSSALPAPIPGYIYIGEPKPGDRYRLILTANGFATHVKLPGSAVLDPQTGQVVVSFQNLPQTPFSDLNLHFFGSERGLLATPTRCGTYPVVSAFTPWDGQLSSQTSTQFFTLDSGPGGASCPAAVRPFNPTLDASSADSTAGAHSPFSIGLTRKDGDQDLTGLTVSTPPGFAATLAGITYCPEAAITAAADPSYSGLAQQSNPSCPAASRIGTATVGAGAGSHPVYLPGQVYLGGPYKGAPLSLAVITPAVSGPYDLGSVVVRAALRVDPVTARITAVSDLLPQILAGIPLRLRSIVIRLDRPNFTLNPTNCDPFSVDAVMTGDQGVVAAPRAHFQVANCASLEFAPKLSTRFTGATGRTGNPALKAVLTYPKGGAYANIASASVTLPSTEIIDNAHISSPCTRVQFAANSCPPGSVIGFAKAETPLLEKPLEGPVYLMTGFGHKLPDLLVALKGQIDINLDGHVVTVHKSVRTTFEAVPDAPVSKFTLSLDGGKKGLLQNDEDLCRVSLHAAAKIRGQNGMSANQNPVLHTPCGSKAKHKRHLSRSRGVG